MIKKKKTIVYLIAGEASGDRLGAALMRDIKQSLGDDRVEFFGIGGQLMIAEGLRSSLFPMTSLSVIGIVEVIKRLPQFFKMINDTCEHIKEISPDVVVTIDIPDFSFRVARKLRKDVSTHEIKLVHYVAPTVWAWREGRAKKIAKIYDHLFTLFDFEPKYFIKNGLDATFVGHPMVDEVQSVINNKGKVKAFFDTYSELRDKKIITLLPGSRESEVYNLLPIYLDVVDMLQANKDLDDDNNDDLCFIVPAAPSVEKQVRAMIQQRNCGDLVRVITDPAYKYICFVSSVAAVAAAGTVSLELGLCGTPTVVTYILNRISYIVAKILVKVKYVSLPNIILNKMVFPELLQDDCNAENIYGELRAIINDKDRIADVKDDLSILLERLTPVDNRSPGKIIAEIIKLEKNDELQCDN